MTHPSPTVTRCLVCVDDWHNPADYPDDGLFPVDDFLDRCDGLCGLCDQPATEWGGIHLCSGCARQFPHAPCRWCDNDCIGACDECRIVHHRDTPATVTFDFGPEGVEHLCLQCELDRWLPMLAADYNGDEQSARIAWALGERPAGYPQHQVVAA
jgi:hypothetical protein